jgi:hypothetical protein
VFHENNEKREKLMPNYVLCPRCELNFIDEDTQEYCDVCIKEMTGAKTFADDLDAEEMEETEICPICGENYMALGEKMCDECKKKSDYEEEEDSDLDKDDAWRSYLDDENDDLEVDIPETEFADELKEEEEEEEEEETVYEDDFEYVSADDYSLDDDDEADDDDDMFDDDDDKPSKKRGGDDF